MSQLTDYVERWKDARVLVVGDVMLDIYTSLRPAGACCPEDDDAPLKYLDEQLFTPGGAANAARNLKSLGAEPILIGAIGSDSAGRRLDRWLLKAGVDSRLVLCASQPTTTKERVYEDRSGRMTHRIDRNMSQLTEAEDRALAAEIRHAFYLFKPDAILLSDYSKGVLAPRSEVCDVLRRVNPLVDHVILDPRRGVLGGAVPIDAITPNQKEAVSLGSPDRRRLFEAIPGLQVIIETRGRLGAVIRWKQGVPDRLVRTPLEVKHPHVCGAGDTFAAALTLARVADAGWERATRLANIVAGCAVVRPSTAAPTADEVITAIEEKCERSIR